MIDLDKLEEVVVTYLKKNKLKEIALTEIIRTNKKLQDVHISNLKKMVRLSNRLTFGYVPDGVGYQTLAVLR